MRRWLAVTIFLMIAGLVAGPFLAQADTGNRAGPNTADDSRAPTTQPAADQANPLEHFAKLNGTAGFWRVGQDKNGVWWFVSPENEPQFLNTVTTVQPFQRGRRDMGPHFVSQDWTGSIGGDGNTQDWAEKTLARIQKMGFRGIGAWSHHAFHDLNVPITRDLNVWQWTGGGHTRFYEPNFPAVAEKAIKAQVEPLKDNHNLVGYYIDNELDWTDAGNGPRKYFDWLRADDPNRQAVLSVIRDIWQTPESFNQDWGTAIKSLDELADWQQLPGDQPQAYQDLQNAFLYKLASDYYALTTGLIHKYDPNHLILGIRFKGYGPKPVVRASQGYTDAQSLNYYVSDALLDQEMFEMFYTASGGQPLIITEYSFHALDGRSGNRNTFGFAAQVMDQQARADGYKLMTTRLARLPHVIGADWFQWMDEPPSGRLSDGEDVNFGVVDVDDKVYEPLAQSIRETTPLLDSLHADSYADDRSENVYRPTFARPTVHVPYLAYPPKLNGELSDWPSEAKLYGLRHSQTIGLDRSSMPLPNVYLGWTENGLYVGFEVFDHDIAGAPADGWWWTRDNAEFWVNTRAVPEAQEGYTPYSHQFFFVPIEFPGDDGSSGVVGRWHRDGDGLSDHQVPQPEIIDAARVLQDRYVVEMFIPAEALHGFNPWENNELRFNFHARNFQRSIDYFWSAPKEARTQFRPNTWGTMVLDMPPARGSVATAD